jgi:tRNA threonylcarbamoyladenosine biosynthesis protein TsaE
MEADDFDPLSLGLDAEPAVELELANEEQTRQLAAQLADELQAGDFVGLVGPLGSGKTTLVKGLVASLSAQAEAHSPTYTLLNDYDTQPPVVHIDLYRLESFDDLESIGYWDYVESGQAITCVEWLDRIDQAWPRHGLVIALSRVGGGRRARIWGSSAYESLLAEIAKGRDRG